MTFLRLLRILWIALLLAAAGTTGAHAGNGIGVAAPSLVGHRIVLLGEVHDNAVQHALRLQAFKALLATGARPALLMEQLDRDRQAAIDGVLAQRDTADAARVIAAGSAPNAGWNWDFYRPFIELALADGLPIVAANVSRDEARRVMAGGLQAEGFNAAVPADIQHAHTDDIVQSHCGLIDTEQADRMALAQAARDQFMARMVERHAPRGVVLLAGNGHVRRDLGVPRWLSNATRAQTVSIGLIEQGDDAAGSFDQVVITPRQPRNDPCAAMRRGAAASS